MLTVKLTEKPCLFCGTREDTIMAKSKEQDFQGVVCPKHMIQLLKKWPEEKKAAGKESTDEPGKK